ncbi:MAG: ASPIC/UnbV domain-containing protein [Proteobacteria bacterium]|nr:ASPIC/UnbV domain-containing protein [Pseudomonadota bacterium]
MMILFDGVEFVAQDNLAVNNHGEPPALLRNVSKKGGNWLRVKLIGRHCNRDAANARVTIHCDGGPPQMRELFLGSSYLSGHSKLLHFGVGRARRVTRVDCRWPCGRTQSIQKVPINQTLVITEPVGGEP